MRKPLVPKSPVPMLTEVVQVNDSLRPAVFPWTAPQAPQDALLPPQPLPVSLSADEALLADKVIARVHMQLALMLPEMMRTAVDELLNEHLQDHKQIDSPPPQTLR
jgi:hypothetical protein